jgi:hypothetical protein
MTFSRGLAVLAPFACAALLAGAAHVAPVSVVGRWDESVRPAALVATHDGFAMLLVRSPHVGRASMLFQRLDGSGAVRSEHELFDTPSPVEPGRAGADARGYSMRAAVAPRPGGGFLVAAAKYEPRNLGIWVQRTSADGSPEGAPVRISDVLDPWRASVRLIPLRSATVALWISPDDGEHERLYACPLDADGHPGDVRPLAAGLHREDIALAHPEFDAVAIADNTFAVVWAEDGRRSVDLIEQEFGADGTAAGKRMLIAGGAVEASKPVLQRADDGLVVVWRETAERVTTLRGAILGRGRKLGAPVEIAKERFLDVRVVADRAGLVLATLEPDRAGVALRTRALSPELALAPEPLVEIKGPIDQGSLRSSGNALVWSQRDDAEQSRVLLWRAVVPAR